MSIKLEQALATRKVLVQKIVSGEAIIKFKDSNINDVMLNHGGIVDLMAKRGVTPEAIRNSNLKDLYTRNIIRIL